MTPVRTAFIALLLLVTPAAAEPGLCSLGNEPAATLLLPYFEVHPFDPHGPASLFSIVNAVARPVLTHVTLWTDLGVPTLDFFVYLTGHDVQTVSVRDLFDGRLPATGPSVSPGGPLSDASAPFPECDNAFLPPPSSLPAGVVESVRAAHRGQPVLLLGGACAGLAHGDDLYRGYVTIDVAERCDTLIAGDEGYFGEGGVAGHDNVLWGDFYQAYPGDDLAQGENLVRIQAFPGHFQPGDLTFYGRFSQWDARDQREPLPHSWSARYMVTGPFDAGSRFFLWRDPGAPTAPFACGGHPPWYPLRSARILIFDEQESFDELACPDPGACQDPMPAVTQNVQVGEELPVPFDFGFAWLDLDHAQATPGRSQAWLGSMSVAKRRFSVGLAGTALGTHCRYAAEPLGERPP